MTYVSYKMMLINYKKLIAFLTIIILFLSFINLFFIKSEEPKQRDYFLLSSVTQKFFDQKYLYNSNKSNDIQFFSFLVLRKHISNLYRYNLYKTSLIHYLNNLPLSFKKNLILRC
jgi:hypothetical protein